jgi:ssRNA-specific RNase YbeY (16S rRNA maturation enzyme)
VASNWSLKILKMICASLTALQNIDSFVLVNLRNGMTLTKNFFRDIKVGDVLSFAMLT